MGFLIKFILGFTIVYFLMKSLAAFLMGKRGRHHSNYRSQEQRYKANKKNEPENQQDRIIEYQKKNFETSEVEDADFVEIKHQSKI